MAISVPVKESHSVIESTAPDAPVQTQAVPGTFDTPQTKIQEGASALTQQAADIIFKEQQDTNKTEAADAGNRFYARRKALRSRG